MSNPCPGYVVTTPYGKPGNWAAGYHTGDDYAAPSGTPVVAAKTGTVVKNTHDDDYGYFVEIETEGIRHRYCHLRESALVSVGHHVEANQHIGHVGSTGNSTGPHLHFEERFDPYGYWEHRPPQFNRDNDTTKGWLDMLSDTEQRDLYEKVIAIFWMVGNMKPTPEGTPDTIGSRIQRIEGNTVELLERSE